MTGAADGPAAGAGREARERLPIGARGDESAEPPPATPPVVAVIGPGEAGPDEAEAAEEVGTRLAQAGAVVVCGGLGGVMEAACRGARAAGGRTVGILPGDDRRAGNAYLDVAVPTGMGQARNVVVVNCADAVVAVGGGYGTLAEIALALRRGIPVVGLRTWRPVLAGRPVEGPAFAATAAEAVEHALTAAGADPSGRPASGV